ncbi:MAG: c-type cytochrome biogenesis protein CcmI [Rubrivivax sp.]|jgi:cytochrome c-type biogenesis protein CcmH
MKQDIPALRLQLQQLQAQHVAGTLDDAAYAQAKAPLEQLLLSCVLADDGQVRAEAAAAPRPGFKLLALLAVGVIGLAVAGYSYTGSPGATVLASSGDFAGTTGPDAERQQFVKAIEQLAQRLNSEPDNHEGWAMLARSYAALGEHAKAMSAFARTGPLLQTDAALAADYADAMGVLNNRSLQGEPSQWIERALKIDANHPKALALAGTAAMEREDFAGAARHWERLAALTPPDADYLPRLQASIAEAKLRAAGLPATAAAPDNGRPSAAASATQPAAPAGAGVQGSVRLSAALAQQVSPDDSVFVFIRAAEGPRMPLAIARYQVKDLPLQFTLDDRHAMASEFRLSKFSQVVVSARISKSGQAAPAPGDLLGQSTPVANDARGVAIEINQVVKN